MGVIARRRPLPGISARYVRAVLWRGLDAAGHSADEGPGRRVDAAEETWFLFQRSESAVTEPLRFFFFFPFLSLWTLVSNVYPLVSCYVVCRNEMTKIRHLVIKTPRYCPRCPPSGKTYTPASRRRAAVRNIPGTKCAKYSPSS